MRWPGSLGFQERRYGRGCSMRRLQASSDSSPSLTIIANSIRVADYLLTKRF